MTEMTEKEPKQTTDEEVEEAVVTKLRKVITIKKELSDKQKAHLDKLAKIREGKRYALKTQVEQVPIEQVILPEEIKVKKPRRKKEPIIVYESESESSEEPDQIIVKKKSKRTKPVPLKEVVEPTMVTKKPTKPRAKPKPKVALQVEEPQAQPAKQISRFNFRIC